MIEMSKPLTLPGFSMALTARPNFVLQRNFSGSGQTMVTRPWVPVSSLKPIIESNSAVLVQEHRYYLPQYPIYMFHIRAERHTIPVIQIRWQGLNLGGHEMSKSNILVTYTAPPRLSGLFAMDYNLFHHLQDTSTIIGCSFRLSSLLFRPSECINAVHCWRKRSRGNYRSGGGTKCELAHKQCEGRTILTKAFDLGTN